MNDRSVLALITAVCVWGLVGVVIAEDTSTPVRDRDGMRVATYNVHQWHTGDGSGLPNLEPVLATLQAVDADIVGLQETEGGRMSSSGIDGSRWLAHRLGMHYERAPIGADGGYGVAILSRWPIEATQTLHYTSEETVERHALYVTLGHPDGPLRVAVTHLEIERHPRERMAQAQALQAAAPPEGPFVLLGDFNAPAPDDAAYRLLSERFTDAWTDAGRNTTEGRTSPVEDPQVRIDHIYIQGLQAVAAGTFGDAAASDHRGVWADLVPQPPEAPAAA